VLSGIFQRSSEYSNHSTGIKKTVSKDNATQYQPSQDSKRISASTSIGGASNAAAGFHSLTGSIHEYADHIHDTCRHLEAELAAEQRRNEVLGQQADILKREYKDKYQDSQSTLMDLQVKHENLTEQYKSEVLDLELELVEAKQKIAELRASPSEQAKKHKDELDELRKRLQAETQRADAAENEAEKFKAKYADLKKNVFSFITDDE
jgi:chromosome segregation ATPase